MDRTAWIVVTLCVIGLVAWEFWIAKQTPPRPTTVRASPTASPFLGGVSATPPTALTPAPVATATPAVSATPAFADKIETLRNGDLELRLTNRGGGIAEAVLLNHISQGDQRVIINSKEQVPIGAIVDQPQAPRLDEFTLSREADSAIKCERTADNITIRK